MPRPSDDHISGSFASNLSDAVRHSCIDDQQWRRHSSAPDNAGELSVSRLFSIRHVVLHHMYKRQLPFP